MAKTYYIFRHGLTHAVKTGTGYGLKIFSAPIIEEGKDVLKRLGLYLKDKHTEYNISSPVKRCRQTVEIISEFSGKEFVFDKRLSEFFLETRGSLDRRIKSLVQEIDKKGCSKISICTHGAIIAALIAHLTSQEGKLKQYDPTSYPDPGILVIIDGGHIQEINFNRY